MMNKEWKMGIIFTQKLLACALAINYKNSNKFLVNSQQAPSKKVYKRTRLYTKTQKKQTK